MEKDNTHYEAFDSIKQEDIESEFAKHDEREEEMRADNEPTGEEDFRKAMAEAQRAIDEAFSTIKANIDSAHKTLDDLIELAKNK